MSAAEGSQAAATSIFTTATASAFESSWWFTCGLMGTASVIGLIAVVNQMEIIATITEKVNVNICSKLQKTSVLAS